MTARYVNHLCDMHELVGELRKRDGVVVTLAELMSVDEFLPKWAAF